MRFGSRRSLVYAMVLALSVALQAQPILQYPNKYDAQLIQTLKTGVGQNTMGNAVGQMTVYPLHFADPKAVAEAVHALYPTLPVVPDLRTRTLMVVADPMVKVTLKKLMPILDRPMSQIRIEVKVIEVSTGYLAQHKALFSKILSGVSLHYEARTGQVLPTLETDALLSELLDNSEVKILAKPTILTLDGNKASISVGEQEPYITQIVHETYTVQELHQVDSGIVVDVLPKVVSANQILAEVNTEISGIKDWKILAGEPFPVVSRRKTNTKVYLKPGETLVIAGLYEERLKTIDGGVPILKDLPGVGGFFAHQSKELAKSDILFFITPHIQ